MSKLDGFIKKAVEYQQKDGSTSDKAVSELKKVIDAYDGGDEEEYNFVYANYMLMWIYANKYEINNAVPYARKCLEILVPQKSNLFHFTDEGQFKEEALRYAANTVGWFEYENAKNDADLEKALKTIEIGTEYASDSEHFYVLDTQVRILLKLGRKNEAYNIVNNCMRADCDFSDFQDIAADSDYRQWLISNDRFTDDEKKILQLGVQLTKQIQQEIEKSNTEVVEDIVPQADLLSYNLVKEELGELFNMELVNNYTYYLVYHGDVSINGDLDDEWIKKQYNIIRPLTGMFVLDLREKEDPSWDLTDEEQKIVNNLPNTEGLCVFAFSKIEANPGKLAGIELGDIIVSVNGIETLTEDDYDRARKGLRGGDCMTVEILRNSKLITKEVILGKRSETGCPRVGLIIDGHLKIKGDYSPDEMVSYVYIKKGMTCNYTYADETSFTFIDGGAKFRYMMEGGINGGDFFVSDGLLTPYIVNKDLAMNEEADCPYIGIGGCNYGFDEVHAKNEDGEELKADDISVLLSDEALSEGEFDRIKFYNLVRDGKNPFLDIEKPR